MSNTITPTPELAVSRGVEHLLPDRAGLLNVMQQRRIRVYLGIDPTGNELHLGHLVVLRKLQQFAELGHEVILLIGNGTVKIGDPTGKDKTRPMITDERIEENFKTWKDQASKILDFNKIVIRRNGDWFDAMSFAELIQLFSNMTVQQLMERDMFQDRIAQGAPIHAHEILYPILQGYDSVEMEVDLEIGGTDQLFNMMVGRQMLQSMKGREKWVLTVPLLLGTDGRKMGKSLGNFIGLTESADNMFGKLMSIADDVIIDYFRLLTNVSDKDIETYAEKIAVGENPMAFKKILAWQITADLHNEKSANEAQSYFERTVQQGEIPTHMPEINVPAGLHLTDLVMLTKIPSSRSEARRLISQGAVSIDSLKCQDENLLVDFELSAVLKVGKRGYFQLTRS